MKFLTVTLTRAQNGNGSKPIYPGSLSTLGQQTRRCWLPCGWLWGAMTLVYASQVFAAPPRPLLGVQHVIAHRGASEERPENTLIAFSHAICTGATAIEVDVRSTADGHLVVMHDRDVARTTDGKGNVSERTLDQLKQLDAGSHFDAQYADQRIPTLAEVLQLAKGQVEVLLDLKEDGGSYAANIAKTVRQHGDPQRTIIGVRKVAQAELFRGLLPDSPQLAFISTPTEIAAFAHAGVDAVRLWDRWLTDDATLAGQVRRLGKRLHINGKTGDLRETQRIMRFAPDWVLVDHPGRLIDSLQTIAATAGDGP